MEETRATIDIFTLFFVCSGLLITGLSIPMIKGLVKPNWWYGFRTVKTLSDKKIWYPANAYSGRLLLIMGIIWTAAPLILRFVPGVGTNFVLYSSIEGIIVLISMLVLVVLSIRYVRKL
jgi:uncharacterized membrane protein